VAPAAPGWGDPNRQDAGLFAIDNNAFLVAEALDSAAALPSRFPVHVTYRLVRRLPSARRPAVFRAIRRAFNEGRESFGGRLCHFSVQRDHLHLVVEAANREALSRALHALAIRIARAINRVLGRKGRVFADRYHMRILKTPTEVKNALRYVLENRWKHHPARPDYFVKQDF